MSTQTPPPIEPDAWLDELLVSLLHLSSRSSPVVTAKVALQAWKESAVEQAVLRNELIVLQELDHDKRHHNVNLHKLILELIEDIKAELQTKPKKETASVWQKGEMATAGDDIDIEIEIEEPSDG